MAHRTDPNPQQPAAPDLTIVETRVYRGPNVWSYDQALHVVRRPRQSSSSSPPTPWPGSPTGCWSCCRAWSGTPARAGTAAASSSGCARAPGSATSPSTSRCSCSRRPATTCAAARPGRSRAAAASVQRGLRATSTSGSAQAAVQLAVRLVNHLVAAGARASTSPTSWTPFLRQAERTAFGPRTAAIIEEAVSRDIPWIRLNEHSLVQLGQGVHAAAHPGHHDLADQRPRGRHRRRQGAHRPSCSRRRGCRCPRTESVRSGGGRGRGRRPDRLPGRDQAAGRQPRPRRLPRPRRRRRRPRRLRRSPQERVPPGQGVVESMVTGRDYRCLIVGGRMQAIAERVPAHVVGDGEHTVAELVDDTNADPRRGRRAREGADPDHASTTPPSSWCASRAIELDDVPAGRRDGQARADRQHVHRRHLGRPDLRRAPGQRRDRRGGGPGDRPRRRRHRLHLPRHRPAGARDRRRDLRGQRRPRLPDAHPPHGRRAAVHRQAGGRPALPAGRAQPGADRRGHRHQRQDHDVPDDRAHLQGPGPQGRHDLDRRRRHRRAAGHPGRRVRPASRPGWCCRTPASTSPCSRSPAAASCARAWATTATTSPSSPTSPPTTSACAASTPSSSSPRSRPSSSRRCRATASAVLNADDALVRGDAPALLGRGGVVLAAAAGQRGARHDRRALPPRWQGGRARAVRQGRHDRRSGTDGAAMQLAWTHLLPSTFGGSGADERRQRHGRGRCRVRRRRPAARHPPGPAHVHHVVLPVPRPDEPARRAPRRRRGRLLPQPRRHAGAGRLRGALRRTRQDAGRPGQAVADRA